MSGASSSGIGVTNGFNAFFMSFKSIRLEINLVHQRLWMFELRCLQIDGLVGSLLRPKFLCLTELAIFRLCTARFRPFS